MSTPEAQVFARALFDALIGGAMQSLRAAATAVAGGSSPAADLDRWVATVLPNDAPREVRNVLLVMAREGTLDRLPEVARAF